MSMPKFVSLLIGGGITTMLCGCNPPDATSASGEATVAPDGAQISSWQQAWVALEEPVDALSVLEIRKQAATGAKENVVVVGTIGGMPNPWIDAEPEFPWKQGQASFFLVDSTTALGFDDHRHGEGESEVDCPFCRRRAEQSVDSVAMVNMQIPNGGSPPYRIDKILPIDSNDTVVVTGSAKLIGESLLVIDATKIHVRDSSQEVANFATSDGVSETHRPDDAGSATDNDDADESP